MARADSCLGTCIFKDDFPEFASFNSAYSTMMLVVIRECSMSPRKFLCCCDDFCISNGFFFATFYTVVDLILLQVFVSIFWDTLKL